MYTLSEVTIKQLLRNLKRYKHGERSERALRSRASEGILVFIRYAENKLLYDEELSIIRAVAARQSKRQGITWRQLSQTMRRLDSSNINQDLKRRLNSGDSKRKVINHLSELLIEQLSQSA